MAHTPDAHNEPSTARQSPAVSDMAVMFLRLQAVIRITGLSRSTLYRLIAEKRFPRPVRLGLRAVAWRRADIDAWGTTRPDALTTAIFSHACTVAEAEVATCREPGPG